MTGWEAIKALAEGKCVRRSSFTCYFKKVKTLRGSDTVVLKNPDNDEEKEANLAGLALMLDDWEIFEEPHDFMWAIEQFQKGHAVRRLAWNGAAQMSPHGFRNTTNYECDSNMNFLNMRDIRAKDWVYR